MDQRQHEELREMLRGFKEEFLQGVAQAFRERRKDVEASELAVKSHFQSCFSRIEDMLSGPYDKELEWDWVPCPGASLNFAVVLTQRKLRLREMPEFEVSAREYFGKFARTFEDTAARISELGFFLPPRTKLFESFYADVMEGRKLLLHLSAVKRLSIPPEQLDLALLKAQRLFASDSQLQQYLPNRAPETQADKQFYLDIANSVVGLHFKVILPLSEAEEKLAASVRQSIVSASSVLTEIQAATYDLSGLRVLLQNVMSPENFTVSGFLDAYARHYAQAHGIAEDKSPSAESTLDFY